MSPTQALCLVLLLLVSLSIPSSASDQKKLTAYQVLQQYDFPVGLLPNGVTGYELDAATGRFKAYLNGSCPFTIDSYQLKYKSTITGVITKGKLSDLSGIQVKVLIFWFNIVTVTRSADELNFSVGIASANFAVRNFYESPTCGCGFDCLSEKVGKAKFSGSVSSS